ncbi:MAG: hypothetical protein KJ941_11675 [Bacteroidetes bacterium]|nr:hypothetical protein [Bacteroidota bacterium]
MLKVTHSDSITEEKLNYFLFYWHLCTRFAGRTPDMAIETWCSILRRIEWQLKYNQDQKKWSNIAELLRHRSLSKIPVFSENNDARAEIQLLVDDFKRKKSQSDRDFIRDNSKQLGELVKNIDQFSEDYYYFLVEEVVSFLICPHPLKKHLVEMELTIQALVKMLVLEVGLEAPNQLDDRLRKSFRHSIDLKGQMKKVLDELFIQEQIILYLPIDGIILERNEEILDFELLTYNCSEIQEMIGKFKTFPEDYQDQLEKVSCFLKLRYKGFKHEELTQEIRQKIQKFLKIMNALPEQSVSVDYKLCFKFEGKDGVFSFKPKVANLLNRKSREFLNALKSEIKIKELKSNAEANLLNAEILWREYFFTKNIEFTWIYIEAILSESHTKNFKENFQKVVRLNNKEAIEELIKSEMWHIVYDWFFAGTRTFLGMSFNEFQNWRSENRKDKNDNSVDYLFKLDDLYIKRLEQFFNSTINQEKLNAFCKSTIDGLYEYRNHKLHGAPQLVSLRRSLYKSTIDHLSFFRCRLFSECKSYPELGLPGVIEQLITNGQNTIA